MQGHVHKLLQEWGLSQQVKDEFIHEMYVPTAAIFCLQKQHLLFRTFCSLIYFLLLVPSDIITDVIGIWSVFLAVSYTHLTLPTNREV